MYGAGTDHAVFILKDDFIEKFGGEKQYKIDTELEILIPHPFPLLRDTH